MAKLIVETMPRTSGSLDTMKISGFQEGELQDLKAVSNAVAKDRLVNMLDVRNSGLGRQWLCGHGIYGVWFDNEFAYVNIGRSCD